VVEEVFVTKRCFMGTVNKHPENNIISILGTDVKGYGYLTHGV
jgi:hypothetical protein